MVNIHTWGPATWKFFHTVAANINEERFSTVGRQLVSIIVHTCTLLPCPECAIHARNFWMTAKPANITTKKQLISLLFLFHNAVSKRKRKPMFMYGHLAQYLTGTQGVIVAFNRLNSTFHTSSNQMMADEMQRKRHIASIKKWLLENITAF